MGPMPHPSNRRRRLDTNPTQPNQPPRQRHPFVLLPSLLLVRTRKSHHCSTSFLYLRSKQAGSIKLDRGEAPRLPHRRRSGAGKRPLAAAGKASPRRQSRARLPRGALGPWGGGLVAAGEMNSHAAGTSNGGSGDAAAGGATRRNTRMPKCEISRRI